MREPVVELVNDGRGERTSAKGKLMIVTSGKKTLEGVTFPMGTSACRGLFSVEHFVGLLWTLS